MSTANKPFFIPTIEDSQLIFEESLIKIRRDTLQLGQHPSYRYYSLSTHPFAVVILAMTKEGSFVLTEEYRHPTRKMLVGCPGGFIDADEDPLEAAKRELEEETGFQADSFSIIGSAYPYAGISGQKTIYVKASGAFEQTVPRLEASEIIKVRLLTAHQVDHLIESGAEVDGTLCTAFFFYHRQHQHSNLCDS